MYLNREEEYSKDKQSVSKCSHSVGIYLQSGSVSLSVLLVSLAVTVCGVWLVALCGVCGWCQRKLGKRNKPGVESVGSPDSGRGRGEKKAINGTVPGGQKGAVGGGLGDGGGPSRSDSVRSMMTGGIKAGRWQTVQSRLHSGDFKNGNGVKRVLGEEEISLENPD
ncbi:hypothetical protein Q8A67_024986 [Cirrhinus molitorella]|uniref:Uncharacterized protein n=1 Tax=Cirrhinus molitorella TaxID=172907 RepID=A0AA88NZR1_9TELE|nr:hypothetical protein Q8A67_024986 [Cirrhinus molitorella]